MAPYRRPLAASDKGRGKELPRDDAAVPLTKQPRNRRERRALAAWRRRNTPPAAPEE